jgi:beta-lactamase superfamily II metal-dependent hydrolase
MLDIEMLPAKNGDALWIRYGKHGQLHHVLIDCGLGSEAYQIIRDRLEAEPGIRFDLFVLTHVDSDHIDGAVSLLGDSVFTPERVDDVWFNGWHHLLEKEEDDDKLGALQGEYFAALLSKRGFSWNRLWEKGAVVVPKKGSLPVMTLAGGMKVTVLSPTRPQLDALRKKWKAELKKMKPGNVREALRLLKEDRRYAPDALGGGVDMEKLLRADKYKEDDREPNGSSIALLVEYNKKRLLLAGDAFPSVLKESLERLGASPDSPMSIDAFKLSHHGSAGNTSPELLKLISCQRALISTNGDQHSHPHAVTLARLVEAQPQVELIFNYITDQTRPWLDRTLQKRHQFTAVGPEKANDGTYLVKIA